MSLLWVVRIVSSSCSDSLNTLIGIIWTSRRDSLDDTKGLFGWIKGYPPICVQIIFDNMKSWKHSPLYPFLIYYLVYQIDIRGFVCVNLYPCYTLSIPLLKGALVLGNSPRCHCSCFSSTSASWGRGRDWWGWGCQRSWYHDWEVPSGWQWWSRSILACAVERARRFRRAPALERMSAGTGCCGAGFPAHHRW